ncbi:hypothetical protein ACO0LF_28025 [Undibacterium sp. Di27W]|uniref:hypothetical protein n=1 Tax=Undibacterium sp. Di27W TaxID=3413036 RepID=UPI003BF32E9B
MFDDHHAVRYNAPYMLVPALEKRKAERRWMLDQVRHDGLAANCWQCILLCIERRYD